VRFPVDYKPLDKSKTEAGKAAEIYARLPIDHRVSTRRRTQSRHVAWNARVIVARWPAKAEQPFDVIKLRRG
jgi:hypothetical protein